MREVEGIRLARHVLYAIPTCCLAPQQYSYERRNGVASAPWAAGRLWAVPSSCAKLYADFCTDLSYLSFTPQIPLGRMGTTFDIGMGAVFLFSSAAAYVSGDTLVSQSTRSCMRPRLGLGLCVTNRKPSLFTLRDFFFLHYLKRQGSRSSKC